MAVFVLLLLIALNGILAMTEIAMVSSRKFRLEQSAASGGRGARAALRLSETPTRFLSTVQVGITLIGIVSGAVGEAAFATSLADRLNDFEPLAPYASYIATGVVVIAITYLSLVFGELVPKRLALNSPEALASVTAIPMELLSRVTRPFVSLLSFTTDLILRILPGKKIGDELVSEEEIKSLIEKGTRAGLFLETERDLVERIFRLGDQRVNSLMVPRGDITWLPADATTDRVRLAVATSAHSHFPVCDPPGGLDKIVGVVHVKDMIQAGLLTKQIDLKILARQPLYVHESMPVLRLLDELRKGRTRIAFVFDEYGVTTGLITLNDVVEALLGEVARHGEDTEPLAVRREDGSWLLDGGLPVQDLKELMGVRELPHQDRTNFQTLAGFIMTHLGRVPRTGEWFTFDRFRFEIVDMDRHRIDKVLLSFAGADATRQVGPNR